ncbi:MAG: HAD family phosphatase [Kiritimatiellae bacterium]|nr:HAD family phosphatase [Kiritimatiellia bacterium]
MKPAAFLFDLDGTLVDTEPAWAAAMCDWIASRGGSADAETILVNVVGRNWLDIDRWLHSEHPELGVAVPEEDARVLRGYYSKHAANPESMIVRGSVDFFRRVSAMAPCAIVSGSPRRDVEAAARLCGVDDVTNLVLGAGDYAKGKPDPSGFLEAAKRLGVAPADCVVVEDSAVGVASGVAAGMKVLALDRSRVPMDLSGATWTVRDLSEFDIEGEFSA